MQNSRCVCVDTRRQAKRERERCGYSPPGRGSTVLHCCCFPPISTASETPSNLFPLPTCYRPLALHHACGASTKTLYYVCTSCKRRQRERGSGTYVVHGAEAPVADLSLVDEDGLRVIVKDVLRQLRVLTDDNLRSLPSYRHGWLAMNSR